MINLIINTTITTITGIVIGFLISKLKEYKNKIEDNKKNNDIQNEALKILLQNNLTSVFFVYDQAKEIPDYVYKNWLNMLKIYEKLDGDDYVHELEKRLERFKIIKTNILN